MRVHISVWVEFASVYMFFTLLEPKALMINDAAYIAARGGPQVPHKDLKPRAVNAVKDTVVLSVFLVLTHCPHDGQHGGWVAGHTFLSFFFRTQKGVPATRTMGFRCHGSRSPSPSTLGRSQF